MIVKAKHKGGMAFEIEQGEHKFYVDAHESVGGTGKGPAPKGLLLSGLIGCTGMDTASILTKMRVEFESLDISAETELTDEHPKVFKNIQLIYYITGVDLDHSKIKRAVELSMTKYCGVTAMLKTDFRDIGYIIKLNGEEIYASKEESL